MNYLSKKRRKCKMCGLFGFSRYGNEEIKGLSKLTNALAVESAIRGTDATGVAFNNNNGCLEIIKDSQSAYKMEFKHPDNIGAMTGHTRHSTQGSERKNYNNHPFKGSYKGFNFTLCHNGILSNDKSLRKELRLPKTKIETDSYIAVQLLESQPRLNFDSIKYMAEKTEGSFSYTILDQKNNLYLVKGDSPLSILHFPKQKIYIYASTDEILYRSLIDSPLFPSLKKGEFESIEISEGDILNISPDGTIKKDAFEYSYYSGRNWWDYGRYPYVSILGDSYEQKGDYIDDLKSIATFQGIDESAIDDLLAQGFTPQEIEEYIYEF